MSRVVFIGRGHQLKTITDKPVISIKTAAWGQSVTGSSCCLDTILVDVWATWSSLPRSQSWILTTNGARKGSACHFLRCHVSAVTFQLDVVRRSSHGNSHASRFNGVSGRPLSVGAPFLSPHRHITAELMNPVFLPTSSSPL